jgi:hypothetical protein
VFTSAQTIIGIPTDDVSPALPVLQAVIDISYKTLKSKPTSGTVVQQEFLGTNFNTLDSSGQEFAIRKNCNSELKSRRT